MDYSYLFKIILVGDSNVGKTSLMRRFTKGYFPSNHRATIGVDFTIKTVEVDGENVKLQVWDTAGQEKFRALTRSYYHNADGVIVAYDITNRKSFENVPGWLDDVHRYVKQTVFPVIVGNKCDLQDEREVDFKYAQELAQRGGSIALETSAKDADNVEFLFMNLATLLKRNVQNGDDSAGGAGKTSDAGTVPTVTLGGQRVCSKGVLGMTCCRV